MTRLQDSALERFALSHPRVAVREGFADKHVDLTTPGGAAYKMRADGTITENGVNHSIDWSI